MKIKISPIELELPQKFNERFDQLIKEYPTYRRAYEHVEREYGCVRNGRKKYSSYNSFRNARTRDYLKKK